MSLINAINYDPVTQVTKATSTALAMTAFDTANLRLTVTVPPTGRVLVRIRCMNSGNSTPPGVFLGVMNGATVVARQVPASSYMASTTGLTPMEAVFTVTGLTPGATLTWDAAYGVEYPVSSSSIRYGGPNDATANNAAGMISFEVWEA